MVSFAKIQTAVDAVKQALSVAQSMDATEALRNSMRYAGKTIAQMREVSVVNFGNMLESAVERLAHRLKKEAQFSVNGDLHIDIDAFRTIHRGLVHLINNALDHGIEEPAVRKQRGKMGVGVIVLHWERENGNVRFIVEDDGNGIDLEEVRRTLRERSNLDETKAQALSDGDLLQALFDSGFTTRTHVSDVSGRGVGLDAVRNLIEGMGGTIRIDTTLGKGTRFIFSVPAYRIQPSILWN